MTGIFYLPNKTLSMRQDLLTSPGQADAHVQVTTLPETHRDSANLIYIVHEPGLRKKGILH